MSAAANPGRDRAPVTAGRPRAAPRRYFAMNGATMVSIAAVALTIIGMLYLIQTSQVASLGYEMSRMQAKRSALSLEISEMKYEVARFESLQTIEQVARGRLGMTPLSDHEFITIQRPRVDELPVAVERSASPERLIDRALRAVLGVGAASSAPSSGDSTDRSGED